MQGWECPKCGRCFAPFAPMCLSCGPGDAPPAASVPAAGRGLGRRFAPDPRDGQYAMRALLPAAASPRAFRYWSATGWWGDQGMTSQCVAYAWLHYLEDGPVPQRGKAPIVAPALIYAEAQKVDEWPGESYDGTSVRAGAKVLAARGFIGAYHWAASLDDVVQALLEIGPVVIGVNWYGDMFTPDESGLLHVGVALAGGHAVVLNGVSVPHRLLRMKNSWGRAWGVNGSAWLSFDDFARLLQEDGEACLATEVRR